MHLCVVGTGYVGLVTGVGLASVGHHVHLVDINAERVRTISQGKPPLYEPGLESLLVQGLAQGRVKVGTNLPEAVAASAITIIAVGTPLRDGAIDLSYVRTASEHVGAALRTTSDYHVIAIKSTVVPGTTDTLVRSTIERASGRAIGHVGLCVNPEFLREGSAVRDVLEPDRIVIGQWDGCSGDALATVYQAFDCPKLVTTLRNAELIKYTSNTLLATLISFSNEIAGLCEATPGTDIATVMSGVHLDRRLSPIVNGHRSTPGILEYLRAGCGFGGSCLPKDLAALRHYASERQVRLPLLEAVMAVNTERPGQFVALAERALGSLDGARVAVLGLAFKAGTDDVRDSPSFMIINHLLQKGADVRVYDPRALHAAAAILDQRVAKSQTPEEALDQADAAMVVTAWPEFTTWNWAELVKPMRQRVVIDGRHGLQSVPFPPGTTYLSIGKTPEPVVSTASSVAVSA